MIIDQSDMDARWPDPLGRDEEPEAPAGAVLVDGPGEDDLEQARRLGRVSDESEECPL